MILPGAPVPAGRTAGVALPAVLLALVAVALVTAALVSVAAQTVRVADARAARLQVRLAAESAARIAVAGWSTEAVADLPAGATHALPRAGGELGAAAHEASVERLDERRFLIRASARVGPAAAASVGLVIRALGPDEIWRDFGAALSVTGAARVGADAVLTAHADAEKLGWPAELCPDSADSIAAALFGPPPRPAIAALDTAAVHVEPGARLDGEPPVTPLPPPDSGETVLGPLDWLLLERIADRSEAGSVRPAPAHHGGECDTGAPGNWGSPLDPAGPCGAYAPLVFAAGPLRVDGGAGQGVLVVDGDLTLAAGTEFHGLALVRGRLTLEAGAAVFGAVRAIGPPDAGHAVDGLIAYNPCAILRAVRQAPALDRAFLDAERPWVPLF